MMPPAAAISRAATHLKVLSAGAVKYVVTDVAAKFTRDTGDDIELSFATIGGVQKRLEHGETADIIIGTASVIAQMERAGVLVPGSRGELGRTLTGICVHAAAPMPDISTPERFKQTMLQARSVAYTDPQAGGTSGIFLAGLRVRVGDRTDPEHCLLEAFQRRDVRHRRAGMHADAGQRAAELGPAPRDEHACSLHLRNHRRRPHDDIRGLPVLEPLLHAADRREAEFDIVAHIARELRGERR